MITHNANDTIETQKLFLLCPDAIQALAQQAIVDASASIVDWFQEQQDSSINKSDVDEALESITDVAAQNALDTINELRSAIISQIYNTVFTTTVRGLEFTQDGELNDINIDVVFED